mmetsp:Transcript_36541/g.84467  ORF Transcript_36541/g.84467 Transcript_36541/m.84467 type:complete len:378 (-) Transcript_36541:187-1320(-)
MGGGKAPLAFLGKKSWHTKNLKNVERVWIAEEREKAEQRKLEELQKQIEEEREMVELRKLQGQAGIGKGGGEKVDWMYEGPMAETGTGGAGGTAAADEEYMLGKEYKPADAGLQEVAAPQQAGSLLAQKKPNVNDAFSRMHEDPLLLIRQKQMQARESVVKNPLKMNKVKQEIEAQLLREREDKKSRKREKKEAKKSRKRSPSPSLSPSSDEAAPAATSGASSAPGRPSADPSTRQRVDDGGKYGLQSGKRSSYSEAELGPSAELIANAKKAEPARPSKRGRHERPPISEEERKRKLREMQRDADDREVYRDEMIRKEKAASRDDERAQTKAPGGEAAGFIRDMERESIREMDVEDRVKRNRHFQQSGADSNSFMKK